MKRISLLFFTSTGQISLKSHYRREERKREDEEECYEFQTFRYDMGITHMSCDNHIRPAQD